MDTQEFRELAGRSNYLITKREGPIVWTFISRAKQAIGLCAYSKRQMTLSERVQNGAIEDRSGLRSRSIPKVANCRCGTSRAPPRIEKFDGRLRVQSAAQIIASTSRGRRVLETAGAPTYYFPPEDVIAKGIERTGKAFHCEWKGISYEISVASIKQAGWVIEAVYPEFGELCGWYAFYPQKLNCFIDEERVGAQPGGYYGGWVTRDIVGPIKGEPGTKSW